PVPLVGPLRDIPGVGKIVEVIVDRFPSRKGAAVSFMTGVGVRDAGLVYLSGYPPPPDSCNVHLSGPWWEVTPLNVATMGCARGFHFTAGGESLQQCHRVILGVESTADNKQSVARFIPRQPN